MNNYFYIDDFSKQQFGPFTPEELQSKGIKPDTKVWCSGMTDWTNAKEIQDLQFIFASSQTGQPTVVNPTPPSSYSSSNANQPKSAYGSNVYGNNAEVRPIPKNWLVESILVTVLCCMPLGIVAILNATKVETLYYAGDYDAALQASKNAKKWAIWGAAITGIGAFLYFLVIVIIAIVAAANT